MPEKCRRRYDALRKLQRNITWHSPQWNQQDYRSRGKINFNLERRLDFAWQDGFLYIASTQQGDLRLLAPPSGRGTNGEARTRDRTVPADLRADSQATVPPTPPIAGRCSHGKHSQRSNKACWEVYRLWPSPWHKSKTDCDYETTCLSAEGASGAQRKANPRYDLQ
ncbi:hypothetical protein PoB_000007300 [Plakobranchus ocellatus]|uniref:Uncharacterized protein n=1 Tax=Plakobranchus ocellatus TaxID=259542 RepID=A0AAV3XTX1_9GAST|nr:hypothetical protein PoB_000007300 [Plakobranchus ocellatus]